MRVRSRHTSKKQTKRLRVVLVATVFLLLAMLLPKLFSAVSTAVMAPVHAVNTWLEESSSLAPVFIRSRLSLEEQIEELENELAVSNKTSLTLQRLTDENNRLRQLLGINEESRVAASVIARPDELPYDLLQIDRGSDHGIEIGSPVFIGRDIVIGLIVHTAPTYSFVELVTTPGFEATAFISGPNVAAIIEGMGGGVARVRVPQGVLLKAGNLVYLPSVEPGAFGRISHVENRPTQPEQYGYISPDVPISGLFRVSVGKQSQIAHSAEEINTRILEQMRKELLVGGVVVEGQVTATTTASTTPKELEE